MSSQQKKVWSDKQYNFYGSIGSEKQYEVEYIKTIVCDFREYKSSKWNIILPSFPDYELQKCYSLKFEINPDLGVSVKEQIEEGSGRSIRFLAYDGEVRMKSGFQCTVKAQVGLRPYRLIEGRRRTITPLPPQQRAFYLRSSESIDFNTEAFQAWLQSVEMQRRPDEGDLDYAYRSFLYVHKNFVHDVVAHEPPPNFYNVSRICKGKVAGCGHSSNLHVALLRANGIPARVLGGRHPRTEPENGYRALHVMAEFWCDSVGWIPVNHGIASANYNPDDFFGKVPTGLITFLLDNDFPVNIPNRRQWNLPFFQSIQPVWSGGGGTTVWKDTDSWKIRRL